MMCSNFLSSPKSPSGLDSDCSSVNIILQPLNMAVFPQEIVTLEQKSDEDEENPKYTMEDLCRSFIKKYENTRVTFEPATLANEFNAKMRRIYDMMNILEGAGIIERVEKSSYRWSLQENDEKDIFRDKNDWYCLKNISSELRELFELSDKGLSCHEIYNVFINKKKGKFNPATIQRRIYECCKVFVVAGLVQKVGKLFYKTKLVQEDIQHLTKKKSLQSKNQLQNVARSQSSVKTKNSSQKKMNENGKTCENQAQTFNIGKVERGQMIRKIVNEFRNEDDLMEFIEELTVEFKIKNSLPTGECSQDTKMEDQSEFLIPNNCLFVENKQMGFSKRKQSEETYFSPQMSRKTIIISSPAKERRPFLFSPNSSFCSFPSNPSLNIINNLKPLFDIKGK